MKRIMRKPAFLASLVLLGHVGLPQVRAAYIPEPATVFYGKVIEHYPQRDFLITEGELVWTLRSATLAKEYRLSARLQALPGGQFSYRLDIPHRVLAYDLTVGARALPLTGGRLAIEHVSISLNGDPLALVAPAIDAFSAEQANRARAYRIDLQFPTSRPDTDGDGFPDWWEDQNGYDMWDPADGLLLTEQESNSGTNQPPASTSFPQWRSAHFPADTSDLNLFASADGDADAIINVLEYAFNLDPKNGNESAEARKHLPSCRVEAGRLVLTYCKNASATDLIYTIEISDNLIQWSPIVNQIESVALPEAEQQAGWVSVRLIQGVDQSPHRWMRVLVERTP